MKLILVFLSLCALCAGIAIGELDAWNHHAGDYDRGYADGFNAGRLPSLPDRAVANLVCSYADLVCPRAKHASAH